MSQTLSLRLCLVLLSALLMSAGAKAAEPAAKLVFACRADSDVYRVLSARGPQPPRYDTPAAAVAAAPDGAGLLALADGYPAQTTAVPDAVFAQAASKRLRLYVEYPAALPGLKCEPPRGTQAERAVVASEFFGGELGPGRILAINGLHFVPVGVEKSHLVAARVAGFDFAVLGLPKQAYPLLFEHPQGNLLIATTRLSQFVAGRYAPQDAWQTLWRGVLRWLAPDAAPAELQWTPVVRASYGRDDPLPADAEKQALHRGADWFLQSKLLLDQSRLGDDWKRLQPAGGLLAKHPSGLVPTPPPDAPVGDGSLGILEAPLSVIQPDGSQLQSVSRRGDCHGEAAMALAFGGVLNGDAQKQTIARNLLDFWYFTSDACKRERGDPKHGAYGLIAWGIDSPAWYVANYGDDNARLLMGTLATAALLREDRWDEPVLRCLLANLRTTGRLGFRDDRIDLPALSAQGWLPFFQRRITSYSPHMEAYLWACYLWAYRQTGYEPFYERAETALRMTMAQYTDGWRWTNGLAQEKARIVLPLAWLVRAKDTPEHREWLRTAVAGLVALQEPCGAIREELGLPGRGMFPPPASNEAYGTNEASLIQQNGDPVSDLLYTTNFALLGLHEAAAAGDQPAAEAEAKLAAFLCRIQVRSETQPALDGGWFRAFDFRRWEPWGSNADAGWGAWAIESGWTQGWITSVFGLRQRKTSLWDLTTETKIARHFDRLRSEMLPDEALESLKPIQVRHAAVGQPVRLAGVPSPNYPGNGAPSLADGLLGPADHTAPEWLGFEGRDLEATLDLGAATEIRALAANFLRSHRVGIFLPKRVEFSVSDDGMTFHSIGQVEPAAPARDMTPQTVRLTVTAPRTSARYVRLYAENFGLLPTWVIAGSVPAWLFADEFLVNPDQALGQACPATHLAPDAVGAAARETGPRPCSSAGECCSVLDESDWETISALLDNASSTYTETWDDATCRTLMSGGYLGNGDFGAHLGGTRHSLKYYLGKNGFHAGNDVAGFRSGDGAAPGPYKQHILNLAILTVEGASGTESGNVYSVTQDLKNAEVRAHCTMAGSPVQARAYLSASGNALVLELSTSGGTCVPLQATLSVIGNAHVAKSAGTVGPVAWVTKEPNAEGAPFYVKGAVAARVLGASTAATTDNRTYSRLAFTLPASGEAVRLFLQAEHTKNAASPLAAVQVAARDMTDAGVAELYAQNQAWWKQFWLRSYIKLGDDVQRYWYNHLYLIGSAARSRSDNGPGQAPGHWGPWNRADDMKWFGNLGMNYNAQNPYYGTFAANHVDLVDPYVQTIKYYAENTGRKRVVNRWVSPEIAARMPANCRGVEFEGSFTSHGTPSAGGGSYGSEDCCMATNAVFGILPIVWKWKYSQDTAFLADIAYPLMRDVADFFDDYVGPPVNGRYDVYGSVHEGADWFAKNDMFSLGAIKFLYREIVAASIQLGRDADRRAHWHDILDNMSEYPLQAWGAKVTFRPDADHDVLAALQYQGGARNTGLMFTTTFDNIGAKTLPAYKLATCNTLDKGNMFHPRRWCGWQNGNDFGMMFVMAVRAGYRPDRVIEAIKGWKPEPNGVVSQKDGGGIETAGIIEAINNMLLQSHDGVLRVFPNWDQAVDAEFKRLRAVGAFLVEAKYRAAGRVVDSVRIFSEKGTACVLQSPFDGAGIAVTRADNRQSVPVVQDDEEFTFRTTAGVTYEIARAEWAPVPADAPVIATPPMDATVVLPGTATFTVSAAGKNLRYQWQKNRAEIPGATSPSYTTPATTLWDIGSAFRCVVTNTFGATRSRPGILNSAGPPSVAQHPILGTWSYQHAGRNYTREFTQDGRCILKDGDQIGWIKTFTVDDDRTVLVEGQYPHVLIDQDTLRVENVFTAKRRP